MTTPPADTPKKRWWRSRWLWGFAVFVALVASIPFAMPLYDDWRIERELAAAVAEADRLDPGWRIEDIHASWQPIPDAENGAAQLLKVGAFFPTGYQAEYRDLPWPEGMQVKSSNYRNYTNRIWDSLEDMPEANLLNAQQIALIESERKQHLGAFEEARKLSAYRTCQFPPRPFGDERNSNNAAARSAGLVLIFDVQRQCEVRDMNGAIIGIKSMLTVAGFPGYVDDEYALFQAAWLQTVSRLTNRMLGQGVPKAEGLEEMQSLVERHERVPRFLDAARTLRAEIWRDHFKLPKSPAERQAILDTLRRIEKEETEERPWYLKLLPEPRTGDIRAFQTKDLRVGTR